jgi:hypothetical protein
LAIVVLLSAPLLTGCFGTDKSIELTEEAVTPISAGTVHFRLVGGFG